MENILVKTASLALTMLSHYIRPGDTVVDATMGNGNDTLKLCELVGSSGKVYGFDIQKQALERTSALLREKGWDNAVLYQVNHNLVADYIPAGISAAVFNLGYLPGGDHRLTTNAADAIEGIGSCVKLMKKDGAAAIVLYPGHPEGYAEKSALLLWAKQLDPSRFHCVHMDMINQSQSAPSILLITKKKGEAGT